MNWSAAILAILAMPKGGQSVSTSVSDLKYLCRAYDNPKGTKKVCERICSKGTALDKGPAANQCTAASLGTPDGDAPFDNYDDLETCSTGEKKGKKCYVCDCAPPVYPPYPYNPYDFLPAAPEFSLTSAEVVDGGILPLAQASAFFNPGAMDQAPSLSWSGFPPETQSFVVTMFDPDAPTVSGFWHWAIYDIPANVTSLPLGGALPPGAKPGLNDAGTPAYIGAGAPNGRTHRYIFCVSALPLAALPVADLVVDPAVVYGAQLNFVMYSVGVIGRAFLTATFTGLT